MTSVSPDGQIEMTLLNRMVIPGYDYDVRVRVKRGGQTKDVAMLRNDGCGFPRKAAIIWTKDSTRAALFICEGLCSGGLWLYDSARDLVIVASDDQIEGVLAGATTAE